LKKDKKEQTGAESKDGEEKKSPSKQKSKKPKKEKTSKKKKGGSGDPANRHLVHISAKALYEYVAQSDVEISFKAGEMIIVYETGIDGGWSKGECGGRVGHFPATYVEDLCLYLDLLLYN